MTNSMCLQTSAKVFWVILLLVGILGFIPGATNDGMLLGIFAVNAVHNIIHILSGIIAIYCSMQSQDASKKYFQIFGIVYLLVTILGALNPGQPILGFVAHNMADLYLHIVVVLVSFYFGFIVKKPMGNNM